MNKPKFATARVDTERLVRQLLDAFNSLKTTPAPHICSSPGEEQQRPLAVPRTPLEALTGAVSDIDAGEPEQVSAFEKSSQHEIIEEFRGDHEVIERLRVTPQELQALSSASLLGSLTCKQDVLFMLRQIREARKREELQATVPPEPLYVPDENVEPSQPGFSEMAERLRRESLAKLTESDSLRGTDHRSTFGRFGVFSSALGLMAAITWSCIKMMLNWRHHL